MTKDTRGFLEYVRSYAQALILELVPQPGGALPDGPFYRLSVFPVPAGEGPGTDGGNAMTDKRNAPRQALRAAVRELEGLRGRLLDLADRLAPDEEPGPEREDRGESAPELVETVLRCVVLDRLEPAIRDLAGAAGSMGKAGVGEERPGR